MNATKKDTLNFKNRFDYAKDFYSLVEDLYISSVGIGTFSPEPYKEENYEFSYKDAIVKAVSMGVNVIDTASNYRYTQSEKEVATALQEIFANNIAARQELVICSKGGFLQLEYPFPQNPYTWIKNNVIDAKLAKQSDISLDQHCLSEEYIEWSFEQSLQNLGIDALDIYYLHNIEMQFGNMSEDLIYLRCKQIFKMLDKKIKDKKLKYYGLACWNGLLNMPSFEHISLEKIMLTAGKGFKFLQVPFNLAKTNAYSAPNQQINGEILSLFEAAKKLELNVITSSSFLRANIFKGPFSKKVSTLIGEDFSDYQKALRFCAASPSKCALFSSKDILHIEHNLQIAKYKKINLNNYEALFKI